jgi:hypothetical protein
MNRIVQLNRGCQVKFKVGADPLHVTKKMCTMYCGEILNIEGSPWGKNSDPIKYFVINGNSKLSLNQRIIIRFLHKEYFSRGKPCYLKRGNIIKQSGISENKQNLTRTIKKLVDRGILLKITGESNKQKTVFILPNIYHYSETNNFTMRLSAVCQSN